MPGGARQKLQDPSVFSMSNLRDVVDRLVSGFFYTAPHSPACAQSEGVVCTRYGDFVFFCVCVSDRATTEAQQ